MKKVTTFLFLFCYCLNLCFSQSCLSSGITFVTQNDVNQFVVNFPNCTEILGDVQIGITTGQSTSNINDLSPLSQLTSIGGNLTISKNEITTLSGFENLTTIGGEITITENNLLTNVNWPINLTSVQSIYITENLVLSSIAGFDGISDIGGELYIDINELLTDVTAFQNLTSVGETLLFANNNLLQNISGFGSLTTITGNLNLIQLNSLNDLSFLNSVTSIGNVTFSNIESLTNFIGLGSVNSIIGNLQIVGNNALISFEGWDNLSYVGELGVFQNEELLSLNGLENLTTVDGNFRLFDNTQLNDLNALNQNLSIFGSLNIKESALSNLGALDNMDLSTLSMLELSNNPNLMYCNMESICNYISNGGNVIVENNAPGCSNIENVTESCENECLNTYIFATQEQVDLFPVFYPNCTNIAGDFVIQGDMNNLNGFNQIVAVSGLLIIISSDTLTNLIGLENITSAGSFQVEGCQSISNLQGIENLQTAPEFIKIVGNPSLASLEGLNNIPDTELLIITSNNILTNLNGLNGLTAISNRIIVRYNNMLTSFEGLENLNYIGNEILFKANTALTSLTDFGDLNLSDITILTIEDNTSLSICNEVNFCNAVATAPSVSVNNNAQGCNSVAEIEEACANSFSKIQFTFYYDENQNQNFDADELFFPDASVTVSPLNATIYGNQENGGFVFVDLGTYNFEFDIDGSIDWMLTNDASSFEIVVDEFDTCDTLALGFFPVNERLSNMTLINGPPARCGEWKTFDVHVKNRGTTVNDGILWLEVDPIFSTPDFIDLPDTTILPNTYGWFYNNLYPGHSITKEIELFIPTPPFVEIGDSIHLESFVHYNSVNAIDSSLIFNYTSEVRCSFDPNDKLVNPERDDMLTLFEQELIYTIRFQNTGNDEAYNIIIRDTLNENLDPTTFRFLSSSHPEVLNTTLEEDQYLIFNFENIFLPDSTTNFDESQGYVSYLIEAKEGIPEETNITNTANIYFDFNPPIVTNTTSNIMVSQILIDNDNDGFLSDVDCNDGNPDINPDAIEIPNNDIDEDCDGTDLMVSTIQLNQSTIELFPNPVSEFLFIKKDTPKVLLYEVIDLTGQVISNGKLDKTVNQIYFKELSSGIYFIKIIDVQNEQFVVEKFVK